MNDLQHSMPQPPTVGSTGDPSPLYSRWLKRGDLVFDIGAHVGDRTRAFLAMGCRVVAVEPQADCAQRIPAEATVINKAVASDREGRAFFRCDASTYMSTVVEGYPNDVYAHGGYRFREAGRVETVTLDDLIGEYGVPAFCKIDVEGNEADVLAGLSVALPALSFEVHDFNPEKAYVCVDMLQRLGSYHFDYSPRESFELEQYPPAEWAIFGDVYATRIR